MKRLLLTLAALFFIAPSALANAAAPRVPHRSWIWKEAHVTYHFETQDEYPDHVFVLYRQRSEFNEAERQWVVTSTEAAYVDFSPSKPLVLDLPVDNPLRKEKVVLLFVARWVARIHPTGAHPTALDLAERYVGAPYSTGVTKAWSSGLEPVSSWEPDEVSRTYQVRQPKAGDTLELVLIHTNEQGSWPCLAILLVPVAILLGGYWLVIRMFRKHQTRHAKPSRKSDRGAGPSVS